jgi:cell division transport system ATP-binding protein
LSNAPSTILQLQHAAMRYGAGEEVLRDLDLTIEAGSFHFLVGPSGAGKTSLLRLISLSYPPSAGTITLFGRDVLKLDRAGNGALRRRIGVIFQDFRLLDHMSAFDNVALPLRIAGADEDQLGRFVSELLAWIGLSDLIEHRPPELSMGQRQLLAVARAVVTRPGLLLADEPTSSVDPARADRLMRLFIQLNRLGTAVILATHSRDLLCRHPFALIEMAGGRIVGTHQPALAAAE